MHFYVFLFFNYPNLKTAFAGQNQAFRRYETKEASLLYLFRYSNGDIPVIFLNVSRNAFSSEYPI